MARSSADGDVQFSASVTMSAGTEEATFTGTIDGNVMRGTMAIVGHPQGTFIGTRPDAAGRRAAAAAAVRMDCGHASDRPRCDSLPTTDSPWLRIGELI